MVAAAQYWRIAIIVASALIMAISAEAAVFRVAAEDVDGPEGLVARIRAANQTSEPDEIILAPGTYTLDQPIGSTDGPNGLPTITGVVTITSDMLSNTNQVIIERASTAAQNFRIFHVSMNGALTLIGITGRNGTTSSDMPRDASSGGGLYNRGRLTVINSVVTQNTANGDMVSGGGGIFNHSNADRGANRRPGLLVVASSAVTCNVAGFRGGGGILNDGTLILSDSTISLNTADDTEPIPFICGEMKRPTTTGGGAGLMNTGTARLEHSLVSANTGNLTIGRTTGGGGIANSPVPCRPGFGFVCDGLATMSIFNSTISGNVNTRGKGGGIDNAGNLSLNFVTLTKNRSVASPADDNLQQAGGVNNDSTLSQGRVFVTNSILGENSAGFRGDPLERQDCSGDITSRGFNVLGTLGGLDLNANPFCNFSEVGGDHVGIDLQQPDFLLAPFLEENGGPTQTHALRISLSGRGNPAIDGANPADCAATDQRRLPRPALRGCDIGAYEFDARPRITSIDPGFVIRQSMVLTEDFSGGIIIGEDGIELNCDGHMIRGTGRGTGIELIWRRGVTVRNCTIEDFNNGILLEDSTDNVFLNNRVRFTRNDGVHIVRSAGNIFDMSEVAENGDDGVDLEDATANVFRSIHARGNTGNGFIVSLSSLGNLFVTNRAEGSGDRGFRVRRGSSYNSFIQNFSCNNASTDFEENSHPNLFQANTFCSELGIRPREKF
jgi:parallel beta-helix repeat protein